MEGCRWEGQNLQLKEVQHLNKKKKKKKKERNHLWNCGSPSCRTMRREEVIVTWLWTGYTYLTYKCSLFGEQAPDCPHSSALLSFPCILIKCQYYSKQHYTHLSKVCCTAFCKWPLQWFRSCSICYQYWSCTADINSLAVLWILVFQLSHSRNVFHSFIAVMCIWMLRVWSQVPVQPFISHCLLIYIILCVAFKQHDHFFAF